MVRILRLILTCSLLLISTPLLAQEASSESEGWRVSDRCLGELPYPTIPQNQWDFEGVIYSRSNEGIHALRADRDTPYFVALLSDDSFAFSGDFSPDGRWFAYPIGHANFNVNSMGDEIYVSEEILVVSTDSQEIVYRMPWFVTQYSSSRTRALPPLTWIDNEFFAYEAETTDESGIVNPFTGEFEEWDREIWLGWLRNFSPDFTRAFYINVYEINDGMPIQLYDVTDDTYLNEIPSGVGLWLPDSSGFLTMELDESESYEAIGLYNRDGEWEETISSASQVPAWAFAPDGSQFAYIDQDHLYIANIEDRMIYDTCLTITRTEFFRSMSLAWSPDSQSIVFLYDGYPIILNTETLEMQILRYETGEIIGWYPLP